MVIKSFYRKRKFGLSGIVQTSEKFELWGVGWVHAAEILLSFVQQQQVKFIYLSLHEVAITIKRPYRVKFHPE